MNTHQLWYRPRTSQHKTRTAVLKKETKRRWLWCVWCDVCERDPRWWQFGWFCSPFELNLLYVVVFARRYKPTRWARRKTDVYYDVWIEQMDREAWSTLFLYFLQFIDIDKEFRNWWIVGWKRIFNLAGGVINLCWRSRIDDVTISGHKETMIRMTSVNLTCFM